MHLAIKYLPILFLSAVFLGACGGGGGGDDTAPSNLPPLPSPLPAVQNGVFKDFNVAGLAFVSGQQNGITDTQGGFSCETGEQIDFAIGGVNLGSTGCVTLVTPNQLATPGGTFDQELSNLARFIQMLDEDGDPDNGIVISSAVQQVAATWGPVDFQATQTTDLGTVLATIIADATAVDPAPHALPSEADALSHLDETLACAYAGAYAGRFTGRNSGAAGMVIGWQAPTFGFVPLAFEWEGFDAVNEVGVFGGGGGSITISDLPVIDHTDAGLAGPIAAQFVTPDRIEGTWEGGDVLFTRIGPDNGGRYRFVGRADNRTPGAELAAYLSLSLDSGSFSGQAFDIIEGKTYTITGTLAGDAVSLSADGGGVTFAGVGTLDRNRDSTPREIQGTFDDGSSFSVAACRLN